MIKLLKLTFNHDLNCTLSKTRLAKRRPYEVATAKLLQSYLV